MTYTVNIAGASGFAGAEVMRLVVGHPSMQLGVAGALSNAGESIPSLYPNLAGSLGGAIFSTIEEAVDVDCDLLFCGLPHGEATRLLAGTDRKVVDLSGDFRIKDHALRETWYPGESTDAQDLDAWIYGLTELHRDEVKGAQKIANPGCYPSAALLAMAPLFAMGLTKTHTVIVDAKSGASGAGRGLSPALQFSSLDSNVRAYGFPHHRHTPEIEAELLQLAGHPVRAVFVPHMVPMVRGLLTTCYVTLSAADDGDKLLNLYESFYAAEPFVRVVDEFPETKAVVGSNYCHVTVRVQGTEAVAVAAIDNLGKGAAGQAIQNANIMLGLEETAGLSAAGLYP